MMKQKTLDKYADILKAGGATLIGQVGNEQKITARLSCGHDKEVFVSSLSSTSWPMCNQCRTEALIAQLTARRDAALARLANNT